MSAQERLEAMYAAAVAWANSDHPDLKPLAIEVHFAGGDSTRLLIPSRHKKPLARHSPDFRSVHWYGTDYRFSLTQAAIVRQLWEAWEQGTADLGCDALLESADSESKAVGALFAGHPAWGAMVAQPNRGTCRLQVPEC